MKVLALGSQIYFLPSPCSARFHMGLTLVNPPCQVASSWGLMNDWLSRRVKEWENVASSTVYLAEAASSWWCRLSLDRPTMIITGDLGQYHCFLFLSLQPRDSSSSLLLLNSRLPYCLLHGFSACLLLVQSIPCLKFFGCTGKTTLLFWLDSDKLVNVQKSNCYECLKSE